MREFPSLRAAWARRGGQATVAFSGKNSRRVLHGALNIGTGQLIRVVREQGRGADSAALVAALARETAEAVEIAIVPLPFCSPELMPCQDVWREIKRVVAANRAYADVDELAGHAVGWLDDFTPAELLRIAGLQSFQARLDTYLAVVRWCSEILQE